MLVSVSTKLYIMDTAGNMQFSVSRMDSRTYPLSSAGWSWGWLAPGAPETCSRDSLAHDRVEADNAQTDFSIQVKTLIQLSVIVSQQNCLGPLASSWNVTESQP